MLRAPHIEAQPGERSALASLSCCDVLATLFVGLYKLFMNVCPVVAQCMALHTLCNHKRFLGSPDKSTRFWTHVCLALNGYFILYILGYILWWICANVDNSNSNWRRHLAQTLATLVVGKLWYELMRLGTMCIYGSTWHQDEARNPNDPCSWFFGVVIVTVCTAGFFLPFYAIQLCALHWNNVDKPWKRECARLAAGFIIFTLWVRWIVKARTWWEQPENPFWLRLAGFVSLTITTLGIWTVCMLVYHFFSGWGHALEFAHDAVYGQSYGDPDFSLSRWMGGHVVFTVATIGFFFLWRCGEAVMWIPQNWDSDVPWRRELARWIGGLFVGTLWYHSFQLGRAWVFPPPAVLPAGEVASSWPKQVAGHILLTVTTLGGYLIFRFAQLWWRSFVLGCSWVYPSCHPDGINNEDEEDAENATSSFWLKQIIGHLLLLITTLGTFAIFRCLQLYVNLVVHGWELFSSVDLCKTTRPICTCDQACGFVYLTLASGVVPFPLVVGLVWIVANWTNSHEVWRRHVAQTVGLLVVGKLWWELFLACGQRREECAWAKMALVVLTGGVYAFVLIYEFGASMHKNLSQAPNSSSFCTGLVQASLLTFGIAGLWAGRRHSNGGVRFGCHVVLTTYNVVIIWAIATYALALLGFSVRAIVVTGLVLLSYPCIECMAALVYSESVRTLAVAMSDACIYAWRRVNHLCDHIAQGARFLAVLSSNACLRVHARRKTWWSRVSCNFTNDTYARIFMGEPHARVPGMPGYEAPQVFQADMNQLEPVRSFQAKQVERAQREAPSVQDAYVVYVLACIRAHLTCEFASAYGCRASLEDRFWNGRYAELELDRALIGQETVEIIIDALSLNRHKQQHHQPGQEVILFAGADFGESLCHLNKHLRHIADIRSAPQLERALRSRRQVELADLKKQPPPQEQQQQQPKQASSPINDVYIQIEEPLVLEGEENRRLDAKGQGEVAIMVRFHVDDDDEGEGEEGKAREVETEEEGMLR